MFNYNKVASRVRKLTDVFEVIVKRNICIYRFLCLRYIQNLIDWYTIKAFLKYLIKLLGFVLVFWRFFFCQVAFCLLFIVIFPSGFYRQTNERQHVTDIAESCYCRTIFNIILCHVNGWKGDGDNERLHSTVSSTSGCKSGCHKFESQPGHITLVEIDHEIFFMVILLFCWFKTGCCQSSAKEFALLLKPRKKKKKNRCVKGRLTIPVFNPSPAEPG